MTTALLDGPVRYQVGERDYLDLPAGYRLGEAVYVGDLNDGSDAWHAQRARVVGGSDVASVCGVPGAFKSGYMFWLEKAGLKERDEPSEDMQELFEWGHALEPAIMHMFMKRNPEIAVANTGSWVNVDRPWQGVNPDGICIGPDGVPFGLLEMKYSMRGHGWENDSCPAKYVAQLRYYLSGFGLDHGYLVCFLTGKLLEFYVPRLETMPVVNLRTGTSEWFALGEAEMLPAVESFLQSLPTPTNAGTPPPLRGDDDEIAWLASRNPDINGKDVVISHDLAIRWADARDAKKKAEEQEKIVKAELLEVMGKGKAAKAGYDVGKTKAKTVAMRQNGPGGRVILKGVGVVARPEPYELKPEDIPAVAIEIEDEPIEIPSDPGQEAAPAAPNVIELHTAASAQAILDAHRAAEAQEPAAA